MVTSVEANATRAGVSILEAGGNAVDAAVAVGYALAVTHPNAGNLGGGGFLLLRRHGEPAVAVDFREVAPAGATPEKFTQMLTLGAKGPLASGVPGSVAGLNLTHRRWGRLPFARVIEPAVRLAREGFLLEARQLAVLNAAAKDLRADPAARAVFFSSKPALRVGSRLVQADLARTLERIRAGGDAGFYAGETARGIAAGRFITLEDLAAYRAVVREPLHVRYRGAAIEIMPPPSAGGVAVALMLQMLEQEDAAALPLDGVEALHLFAEVAKRAHAERRFEVGDPDFTSPEQNAAARVRWQTRSPWLERFPIDRSRATAASLLHPDFAAAQRELEHTTHFAVADADGNVVSCTTTLSASFGARYVAPGTGIVMNNSLAAFSTVGANTLAPAHRMTSSMSPTLILDGAGVAAALGSPGGDTIANTVTQVLRNLLDHHLPLDAAIDAPRVHHGFVPDAVRYEAANPPSAAALKGLAHLGHRLVHPSRWIGDANNLVQVQGEYLGYADPREGGLAQGPRALPPAYPEKTAPDRTLPPASVPPWSNQ